MIGDATLADLVYLASNLRERDIEEISATHGPIDPEKLAIEAYQSSWRKAAYSDGLPLMALGAKAIHPGVCAVWGFGTPEYWKVVRAMTIYAKSVMVPALLSSGFHRAQCIVHPNNTDSQRWLKSLGFDQDCQLKGFGSQRQTMLLYSWVADGSRHAKKA